MEPLSIFDRVIIVDNFYTDPDAIRDFVLRQEKTNESDGNYAGVMTIEPFMTQEHVNIISKLVGQSLKPSTSYNGKFRFTKVGDEYKQDIHFDPGSNNCAWAGVAYLTPTDNTEGTVFWKHKRTGLESIPRTQEGIQQYGWNGPDDLKVFLETEGLDYSLWEKTLTIPYKYNRMVLFRPWMFHSPGPAFGDTLDTSRIVQTFFWSQA
jgi:hypothetical protein